MHRCGSLSSCHPFQNANQEVKWSVSPFDWELKIVPVPVSICYLYDRRVGARDPGLVLTIHLRLTPDSVKSDALFSYQPPFNLFAFAILWPASWVLSPRALHTLNVFLIKLTVCRVHASYLFASHAPVELQSFPILIVIALYERYFSSGQPIRQSSKDAAQSFYHSLPKQIKTMAIFETFLGPKSRDLFEAIFEVEVDSDDDLFPDDEEEHGDNHGLRSYASAESLRLRRMNSTATRDATPTRSVRAISPSSQRSPTKRRPNLLTPLATTSGAAELPSQSGQRSPLSRLWGPSRAMAHGQRPASPAYGDTLGADLAGPTPAAVRKMESLLEEMKALPVQRVREDMKELQVSAWLTEVVSCSSSS